MCSVLHWREPFEGTGLTTSFHDRVRSSSLRMLLDGFVVQLLPMTFLSYSILLRMASMPTAVTMISVQVWPHIDTVQYS